MRIYIPHAFASFCLLSLGYCTGLTAQPGSAGTIDRGQTYTGARKLSAEEKGDIFMARKMYREAIDSYSQDPGSSAMLWNKRGIALNQLLDYKDAKKDYKRAIEMDPQYGAAINNLGTVEYAEKSYRGAVKLYRRALRRIPESASVYSNLGTAYFARKDFKRASDAYSQALKLDPNVFEHHGSFGVILEQHSVIDRAEFHYYLAKMYAKEGMTQRSIQCVRKALEEGFKDRRKFMEDPEFAGLRNSAEFQDVLKSEPRVL